MLKQVQRLQRQVVPPDPQGPASNSRIHCEVRSKRDCLKILQSFFEDARNTLPGRLLGILAQALDILRRRDTCFQMS